MSAGKHSNLQTAVAEGRVLRKVRDLKGGSGLGGTLTGSVQANTILKDGVEMIRVTRVEAWDLTVEEWQGIANSLHLDTVNGKD